MRAPFEPLLRAARHYARAGEAEDLVQEALMAAIMAGRTDIEAPETRRWLVGVIRNQARMAARGAVRRRQREHAWHSLTPAQEDAEPMPASAVLEGLPPALRAMAALALTGHSKREVAYLLKLDDAALRQRIAQLRKRLRAAGLAMPEDLPGLRGRLAYGRIRDVLLPALLRGRGVFASHDPDGHLFVVKCSQK